MIRMIHYFSFKTDQVTTSEWITMYNRYTHSIIDGQKWQMLTDNSVFRCQHEHLSVSLRIITAQQKRSERERNMKMFFLEKAS